MATFFRGLSITIGITLGIFVSIATWYWLQLKVPPVEDLQSLRSVIPQTARLLAHQEDAEAHILLDRIPFQVVVSDAGQQVITSNLAKTDKSRKDIGERALKQRTLNRFMTSSDGYFRFYYSIPTEYWDPQLLFPLILGLLMGLSAALWDYLQGKYLEDQTDTLIVLSQTHHRPTLEAQLELAQHTNRQLENELIALRKTLRLATTEEPKSSQSDNTQIQAELKELKTQLQEIKQHSQQQENDSTEWRKRFQSEQVLTEQLQKRLEAQAGEVTLLSQETLALQRDLGNKEERLQELLMQSEELHHAWQEIESLRHSQSQLEDKARLWKKEKKQMLGLLQEQDSALHDARENLKQTRSRLQNLSLRYKKQLELVQQLSQPGESENKLLSIIDEKDQLEHENGQLYIQVADQRSEIQRLRQELASRATRLEQAQVLIEQLGNELQRNQRELNLVSETLSDKLQDLERTQNLYQEEQQVLKELIQERDHLREAQLEWENEKADLNQEVLLLNTQVSQLKERLSEQDMSHTELEIAQLKQMLNLVNQQQQRRNQQIEELQTQLDEQHTRYERLERYTVQQKSEIQQHKQTIARHKSEFELLEQKLSEYEQAEYRSFTTHHPQV